jgi:hypothetical protein
MPDERSRPLLVPDRAAFARELLAADMHPDVEAQGVAVALCELMDAVGDGDGDARRAEVLSAVERFFAARHPDEGADTGERCRARVRACALAWAAARADLYRAWLAGRSPLPSRPADYHDRLMVRLVECWEALLACDTAAVARVIERVKAEQTALEADWLTEPQDLYTRQSRALYLLYAYSLLGAAGALAAGEGAKARALHANAARTGDAGVLDAMLGHELAACAAFASGARARA